MRYVKIFSILNVYPMIQVGRFSAWSTFCPMRWTEDSHVCVFVIMRRRFVVGTVRRVGLGLAKDSLWLRSLEEELLPRIVTCHSLVTATYWLFFLRQEFHDYNE